MASITTDSDGRRRIMFVAKDGKRKTIYLGRMHAKAVNAIKVRVEQLVSAKLSGHSVDDEVARWLAGIGDELADKLASVGLIPRRESSQLAAFLDGPAGREGVYRDGVRPHAAVPGGVFRSGQTAAGD